MTEDDDRRKLESAFREGLPVYYSNEINGVVSLHDVRLAFGKGTLDQGAKHDVVIYLSLTCAKQLSDMLVRQIQAYEKTFGEIPLAPKQGLSDGGH